MASAFLHKLLHSLGSGRYSLLPLPGGVAQLARSVRWLIYSLAWSTTVATARAAIARVCYTAWAAAAEGLPWRDGETRGVEG